MWSSVRLMCPSQLPIIQRVWGALQAWKGRRCMQSSNLQVCLRNVAHVLCLLAWISSSFVYLQIKSFQMLLHLTLWEVTMMLKLTVSLVQAQPLVKLTLSKKIWIWSARLVCTRVWCSTNGMVLHHVIVVCNFQVEYLREELRKVRSELSECVFYKEKAEAQLK